MKYYTGAQACGDDNKRAFGMRALNDAEVIQLTLAPHYSYVRHCIRCIPIGSSGEPWGKERSATRLCDDSLDIDCSFCGGVGYATIIDPEIDNVPF